MANGDDTLAAEIIDAFGRPLRLRQRIAERPHSIFFYPAGLYDWKPLPYFSDLCDMFIYCDTAIHADHFEEGLARLQRLPGVERIGEPQEIQIDGDLDCGVEERPWLHEFIGPEFAHGYQDALAIVGLHRGPWGRQVACRVNRRDIMIYCFRAEAFRCYATLFTHRNHRDDDNNGNAAPKVVCLKAFHDNHPYLRWAAPLGRAVAESPQPELVVANTDRRDDWPWRREWKRFDDWQAVAYWRQHPVTYPVPPSLP